MKKIDTTQWGEFRLGDLFEQFRGKEKAPNQNKEGDIPLINETSVSNGYTRNVKPTKVFGAPAITISINYAETVFYQEHDFCASVNISILKNDNILQNRYVAQYVVALLRKINKKYDYTEKISKDKINDTTLTLPIDAKGNPDWAYMEEYMKALERRVICSVAALNALLGGGKKE